MKSSFVVGWHHKDDPQIQRPQLCISVLEHNTLSELSHLVHTA